MELYTVIVDGEERQYEAGTTYQQIAEESSGNCGKM